MTDHKDWEDEKQRGKIIEVGLVNESQSTIVDKMWAFSGENAVIIARGRVGG